VRMACLDCARRHVTFVSLRLVYSLEHDLDLAFRNPNAARSSY
jgi:hypothetical protein